MNHKLCTLITVTANLLLGSVAVSAQTLKPAPVAKTSTWTVGHTPDGQPDLQGTWTNATLLPLERNKALGAKEFYTEQEKAEMLSHQQLVLQRARGQVIDLKTWQHAATH